MSSITVTNPSSHSQMPWDVQRELKGLELPLASPMQFQVIGPETVGAFEMKRSYDSVVDRCYAVSREMMLHIATVNEKLKLIVWVKESGADMFLFTADSCTYNP